MKRTLLVALLLSSRVGIATAGEISAPFESIEISCSNAPATAKRQLPSDIEKWAQLSCTKYGQVIRAATGWVWHSPKSNGFVRLWAQRTDGDLAEVGHASHFTSADFRKLSQAEAEASNKVIADSLGAKPQPVSDAYVLAATDNLGRVQEVHFVRSEANMRLGNLWGWSCSIPCVAPIVFMGFKP